MYTYDESNKWPGLDDVFAGERWRMNLEKFEENSAMFKKERKRNKGKKMMNSTHRKWPNCPLAK